MKYAKLARSQISATVSGYNCGNANVLRVAAGDFSWSAALFPPTYPRSPLQHEFCRLFSPSSELPACHCGLFVCLTCARVRISCAWAAPKEGGWAFENGWAFQGGFPRGRWARTGPTAELSMCMCVSMCVFASLSVRAACLSAWQFVVHEICCCCCCSCWVPHPAFFSFLLTGATFFAQFAKAMPGTKQICRAARSNQKETSEQDERQLTLWLRFRIRIRPQLQLHCEKMLCIST